MKKTIVITSLLVTMFAVNASAFDGVRKGFVLGGGLGIAPVVKWEGPVLEFDPVGPTLRKVTVDESNFGVGINIIIGYAWDEYNMIVADVNAGAMQSDILFGEPTVSQGFGGVSWYHYFGEKGASAFSVIGLGSYSFTIDEEDAADEKGGILLGGGYEFSPHWQVGGYLTFGDTKDALGKNEHTTFTILVSGIAF